MSSRRSGAGDSRRLLPAGAALLLYLGFGAALVWPALLGDQVLSASASFVRYGPFPAELRARAPAGLDCLSDSVYCFAPWLRFAADSFAIDGRIPLWKPTAAAGAPFVGNGQSAAYFPTNLLAMLLGAPPVAHVLLALFRLVGGAFCAWLLAQHLKLSFAASLLCGLVYGFGGFQMGFYLHTVTNVSLLLPLLVLAADRVVLRPSFARVAVLAAVAALQQLGGHAETAFHSQVALVLLVGARAFSLRRDIGRAAAWRRTLCVIGSLALGCALAAVQVLPLVEYLQQSAALQLRGQPAPTGSQEHPLAAAGFGVALVVALLALRRLATSERGLWWSACALFGATVAGLFAGMRAGLEPTYITLLGPDWFGRPLHYLGPAVYIGESGAFAGAALPIAALGLLQGRPRGPVLVAGAAIALGMLAGYTAPLVNDLLLALPVFHVAWNSRLVVLASLGLAVLAGYGLDALGQATLETRSPALARARLALVVLAPALGGVVALACAVRAGALPDSNAPAFPRGVDYVEARLLSAAQAEPLFREEASGAPDAADKVFYGYVPPATPHDEIRLVYGRASIPAATSWKAAPASAQSPRGAEAGVQVFRAVVPGRDLPPEQTRVRIHLLRAGRVVAASGLLAKPDDNGGTWWPFPARPAAGTTTSYLLMLALALGLVLLAPVAGELRVALRVGLLALVAASLWPFDAGLVALLPADLFYPPSPALDALAAASRDGRMLSLRADALGAETPTYYGLSDLGGYDALGPARVERLRDAALGRSASPRPSPGGGTAAPDAALLGLMSVRTLVDLDPAPDSFPRVPVLGEQSRKGAAPFTIVENPFFLPRARLVGSAVVEPDDLRALALLQSPSFPRERSVVLAAGEPRTAADEGIGSARIVSDRPDAVRVQIEAAAPGWLVLSDTFFPGWVARVDGQPREIVRANVAFRAVAVRPGDGTVEFRYEPGSHRAGAIVSLLAAVLLAAGCVASLRRGREPDPLRPWGRMR